MTELELKAFHDSVARYQALPMEERAALRYSQRTPEASREANRYIGAMLKKHDGSFTRSYPAVREDGRATMIDTVEGEDGTIYGTVDDTWLCPPFCAGVQA